MKNRPFEIEIDPVKPPVTEISATNEGKAKDKSEGNDKLKKRLKNATKYINKC